MSGFFAEIDGSSDEKDYCDFEKDAADARNGVATLRPSL